MGPYYGIGFGPVLVPLFPMAVPHTLVGSQLLLRVETCAGSWQPVAKGINQEWTPLSKGPIAAAQFVSTVCTPLIEDSFSVIFHLVIVG